MQIEQILKLFGFSEKEIAVYLTLIALGPSPVRTIAAKAGVNRGTTYDILKSLITLGVASYYDKESKQYFIAEAPEKLLTALEDKQKSLEGLKEQITERLPELKTMFEKQGGRPTVKLYEGLKGVRHILEDVLESFEGAADKTYYVYSATNVRKNVYLAMKDFSDQRVRKQITVKTIALGEGGQLVGMDERKWMKLPGQELKPTYQIIYAGKVAHISLDNAENPVGVLILNQEIYETQKLVFDYLWKML